MRRFSSNRRGSTAIEYAVIASLIAVAIFAAIEPIGDALNGMFGAAHEGLEN